VTSYAADGIASPFDITAGPDGALWFNDFFEAESGDVVAFVPVSGSGHATGRVHDYLVPAAELAVTVHDGPFEDLDQTYGALGTWVARNAIAVEGPIREYYLPTGDADDLLAHVTEVGWPVFQTT
jgi:effector-binding domain-containing protein